MDSSGGVDHDMDCALLRTLIYTSHEPLPDAAMRQDAPTQLVSQALRPVRIAPELNARGPRLSFAAEASIRGLPVLPNAVLCEAAEQPALANVASSLNCLLVDLTKVHLN